MRPPDRGASSAPGAGAINLRFVAERLGAGLIKISRDALRTTLQFVAGAAQSKSLSPVSLLTDAHRLPPSPHLEAIRLSNAAQPIHGSHAEAYLAALRKKCFHPHGAAWP